MLQISPVPVRAVKFVGVTTVGDVGANESMVKLTPTGALSVAPLAVAVTSIELAHCGRVGVVIL